MSDATVTFVIDPNTSHFISPRPWTSTVPIGNFDPVRIDLTQPPSDPQIQIDITQPSGIPQTPFYRSGVVAVGAPAGVTVDIDFLVMSTEGNAYYVCGLALNVDSGLGSRRTGSVNNAKFTCDRGTLTLFDITHVISEHHFFLQIQDPATGGIAIVDPKIPTGGS